MSDPVQLISDGYQFYEAPLLSTPQPKYDPLLHSAVDVEKNPAWTWPWNFALLHDPAPFTPGPGTGTEPVILRVALPPPSGLLTRGSPLYGQCGQCAYRSNPAFALHNGFS